MELEKMNAKLDKCKGTLLGLAVGDALGTSVEFRPPGTFPLVTDLTGGGVFNLPAGKWTDDTSMALCLADSLIEKKGFNAFDQLEKYLRWYKKGYNSSTSTCFDIGIATRQALNIFESSGQPYCGDSHRDSAGNGSIMRLAPVPIFYYSDLDSLLKYAALSSQTTHAAPQCIDACKYMACMIAGAINGIDKEELLSEHFMLNYSGLKMDDLDITIQEIIKGSFKTKQPPHIIGSGYVVKTLEAALWAFHETTDFESGALKVVNLGNDADTTGAVYGQIAGAYYGLKGIPGKWLKKIYRAADMEMMAKNLYTIANKQL
jgi:ADP-ribosyl-[dinitrogen reductase] hydrolase